jgi:hypothetical protein
MIRKINRSTTILTLLFGAASSNPVPGQTLPPATLYVELQNVVEYQVTRPIFPNGERIPISLRAASVREWGVQVCRSSGMEISCR